MFHPQGPTFCELAKQALSSTERGYDLLGPKFDYTPFRTGTSFLVAFRKRLTEQAEGPSFGAILDVCCGTGAGMLELSAMRPKQLVGIDSSRGMLQQASKNLAGLDCPFQLVRGDAFNLPFSSSFDLVISLGAFGHVLPREEGHFISEIHDSLVTGGKFAFITHVMPSRFSRAYGLARAFNGMMRVRNWLIRPPFIMYYLTFLWPDIKQKLEQTGFAVSAVPLFPSEPKLQLHQFVLAEKK